MNLKNLRKNRGLTLDDLAHLTGISNPMLSNYELGKVNPPVRILIQLADFFECSIDYLLGHETKNILHLDSFTPEQQELLDTVLQLSETNCARVKAYADGLMTADEERETTIRKFRR